MNELIKKLLGTVGVQISSKVLSVLSGIIFARYLGVEQYGLYGFVLSIVSIAMLPVVAGMSGLLIREVTIFYQEKKFDYLNGIVNWSNYYICSVSLVVIITLNIFVFFEFFDSNANTMILLGSCLIPMRSFIIQRSSLINAFRRPALSLIPEQIIVPLTSLIIVFSLTIYNYSYSSIDIMKVMIFSVTLSMIVTFIISRKVLGNFDKEKKTAYSIKKWHMSLLPFTLMTVVTSLNIEMVSVFLGFFVSHESVAYFKVAIQAISLVSIGLTSINTIIMPKVASIYRSGDRKKTQKLVTDSVRLSSIISVISIFILVLFGDLIIEIMFGDEYLPAYPIIVVLSIGQLVRVLVGSAGLILNMTGYEKSTLVILSIGFAMNFILMIILTPIYGEIGAAVSITSSMIIWSVMMSLEAYRKTGIYSFLK